jgi:hypothetical protein
MIEFLFLFFHSVHAVERLSDLDNRYFFEDENEFVDIFISFP